MRWVAAALVVAGAAAGAQAPRTLRDLATDRPDRTESPVTVDKGHVQLELEMASYGRTSSARIVDFLNVNAKLGLTSTLDIQFVAQAHERVTVGSTTGGSTLPDLTVRLKKNLRGNDSGRTAFGAMPFVTLPREGGSLLAGLIVPWSRELDDRWTVGAMSEVDFSTEADPTLVHSVSFGRDVTGNVGAYFELASELPNLAPGRIAWTFDTGLTRGMGANLQFDGGMNIGLNDRAERLRVFVGVSRRY